MQKAGRGRGLEARGTRESPDAAGKEKPAARARGGSGDRAAGKAGGAQSFFVICSEYVRPRAMTLWSEGS